MHGLGEHLGDGVADERMHGLGEHLGAGDFVEQIDEEDNRLVQGAGLPLGIDDLPTHRTPIVRDALWRRPHGLLALEVHGVPARQMYERPMS